MIALPPGFDLRFGILCSLGLRNQVDHNHRSLEPRRTAMDFPIPLEAPVTIATFPQNATCTLLESVKMAESIAR